MNAPEFLAARLFLIDERLETIRIAQTRLLDALEWVGEREPLLQHNMSAYTRLKLTEVNELEFEKKLLETERANLLEET